MRMLGTTGNTRTYSLQAIMRALFEHEGLEMSSVFDANHIEAAA